jgi:hypothetical protein
VSGIKEFLLEAGQETWRREDVEARLLELADDPARRARLLRMVRPLMAPKEMADLAEYDRGITAFMEAQELRRA